MRRRRQSIATGMSARVGRGQFSWHIHRTSSKDCFASLMDKPNEGGVAAAAMILLCMGVIGRATPDDGLTL